MDHQQFHQLLKKNQAGTATHEERTALREKVENATYDELANLSTEQLLSIRQMHPAWNQDKEERMWEEANLRNKMRGLPKLYRWMTVTAIIAAIAVLIYWFMPSSPTVYEVPRGQREYFLLSDSTRVRLNGGSRLTVKPDFNQYRREVFLEGEAYFMVKQNPAKLFVVNTRQMNVSDKSGSSFNVNAYPTEIPVTALINGEVSVTDKTHGNSFRQHTLAPLQKVRIDSALHQLDTTAHPVPMEKYAAYNQAFIETAWTEGKLVMINASLDELARKIARWYDVDPIIKTKSPQSGQRFSFQAVDLTLPKFLQLLKQSNPNFQYSLKGNQLEIY